MPTTSQQLIEALDLNNAILVGHSTGGGEVTRYIGRHGTARVAKAVLVGAIPPLMLKTEANPGGLPIEAFDEIRAGAHRRSLAVLQGPERRPSTAPTGRAPPSPQGVRDAFWLWSMQVGFKGAFDCIKAFSETDLTEDLGRFDIPTLIIHGDDDQIVPDRRLGPALVPSSSRTRPSRSIRARPTACSPPTRTSSTRTC